MTDTTCYSPSEFAGAIMLQARDGEYVRFTDHAALLSRAEAAEANAEKWRSMWEKEQSDNEELCAERDALAAKLALAVEALTETTKALDDIINGEEFGESDSKKARARLHKSIRTIAQLTAAPKEGKDDDQ